ncbi:hypothetical protein F2Q70_00030637 [Brassica cretica]|uniref:SWIM-type domain-containing protein n=1 Tax=Brassica cretica TaxID=69181 RepID=A0A8S9FH31_BRACR|nr:hypothetical protein F2Q70_00030637 [Brassica cretica]
MDCVVDLEHGKCDCGVYAVEKIPCSHAIAAGTSAGLHISTLVCPVYSKDFLFAGYSENICPCIGQQVEERTCFPPNVKRGPGRQKKSRWQSWLELSRMRGRKPWKQHRCDSGVYAVEKIPCSHAIAAGTSAGLHISTLVCPMYSKDFLFAGYSENIYPCIGQQVEERTCFPPDEKRGLGRQKKSRWQSWLELSWMRGRTPRGVEYLLAVRSEIADTMMVQPIDGWRFFVIGGKIDCVVDLEHGKCDCGVYAVEKIPCSHAIAARSSAGLHISTLVCPVYSKDFLFGGYSENIYILVLDNKLRNTHVFLRINTGFIDAQNARKLAIRNHNVSRPVFSLPEDLQLSRTEGRPVSRPGFFLPEDLQVSRPVFSLPEDLQLSRPEGRLVSRPVEKIPCSHAIAAGTSSGTHMLSSGCKAWSGKTEEINMAILVGAIQDEMTQTPEATQEDLHISRPEGRPVSRPEFFLPEDLKVSRPVFSFPEDLQLSRPEGRPVSHPVSDRHAAIKSACDKVFPWATRGICYYHLQDNIVKKCKGKYLVYLVKGAAYAHTVSDFDRRGVEYLLAVRSEIAYMMTVQPIDGWRFFVKGGKMDCVVDLEHGKCDCGVYAVEKIPCSHAIAAGISAGLHISTLVCPVYSMDFLFAGYSENIYPCVGQQVEEHTCFPLEVKRGPGRQKKSRWQSCRGVEYLLAVRSEIADTMTVQPIDGWRFFVKGGKMDCVVDLEHGKCDCGVYAVEKIPCSHAIAAGTSVGLHISTLVCPVYSKDFLFAEYSENIYILVLDNKLRNAHAFLRM